MRLSGKPVLLLTEGHWVVLVDKPTGTERANMYVCMYVCMNETQAFCAGRRSLISSCLVFSFGNKPDEDDLSLYIYIYIYIEYAVSVVECTYQYHTPRI